MDAVCLCVYQPATLPGGALTVFCLPPVLCGTPVVPGMDTVRPVSVHLPDYDINAVCGALKACLAKRFAPLTTYGMYDALIAAGPNVGNLRKTLMRLRGEPRAFLADLAAHLFRVVERQSVNKMSAGNVATIFAVGLIRRSESIEDCMRDLPLRIQVSDCTDV